MIPLWFVLSYLLSDRSKAADMLRFPRHLKFFYFILFARRTATSVSRYCLMLLVHFAGGWVFDFSFCGLYFWLAGYDADISLLIRLGRTKTTFDGSQLHNFSFNSYSNRACFRVHDNDCRRFLDNSIFCYLLQ